MYEGAEVYLYAFLNLGARRGVAGQSHAGKHPVRTVQVTRWASGQVHTGANTSPPLRGLNPEPSSP
jgi:hypothetical protein